MSVAESAPQAPTEPVISQEELPELESPEPVVVNIHDLQEEAGLVDSTPRPPHRVDEFVDSLGRAADEAVSQQERVISFVGTDADPADSDLMLVATGLSAVSGVNEIIFENEDTGNTLSVGRDGEVKHGQDAGRVSVGLGEGTLLPDGSRLIPLISTASGKVTRSARTTLGRLQEETFPPSQEETPEVVLDGMHEAIAVAAEKAADEQRELVLEIGPELNGLAAVAVSACLFNQLPASVQIRGGQHGVRPFYYHKSHS